MTQPSAPIFLDVPALLDSSEVRPRFSTMRFVTAGCAVFIVLVWYFGKQSPQLESILSVVSTLALAFVVGSMFVSGMLTARALQAEQNQLSTIEELVQLRHWPQAAWAVQSFLSQSARLFSSRAQALLYLAMVLTRYHRFEESVEVYDYVIAEIPLDDAAAHAVRLGRAMSLLREENLLDADRAISELRRDSRGTESPGLALVEIYRDVKTGHPTEALEMFDARLPVMRRQLGHRLADVWALAARAYDLLGRTAEAKAAFDNATLLAPLAELIRRYPEVSAMVPRFTPAPAPVEAV